MSIAQALPRPIDLDGVKARQRGVWSSGDYALIGSTLQIVGENLCEALDPSAGELVLDVAAGNGNAALAAARRWCEVTATDYVPALLARAEARAKANGLAVSFKEADAERLPFADARFDIVLSTFGVMFTPDQKQAAAELLRVCRPQGRIGLANWTPQGFVGAIFRAIGRYQKPPAGVTSPLLWGTSERLAELFGDQAAAIHAEPRNFMFRYRSAAHFIDMFRTCYGPMVKAFAALDADESEALTADLEALIARLNRATDGTMIVPGEYLEIVIVRK